MNNLINVNERDDFRHHDAGLTAAEISKEDRPEDLAVAIELKFLLPLLIEGEKDPNPGDRRPLQVVKRETRSNEKLRQEQAYETIAESIRYSGHQATTIYAISNSRLAEKHFWDSHWIVKKANSAEPGPEETALSRGRYEWVPVEISSPKMRLCDASMQASISAVLTALTTRHRLAANYTCEVHVHLGRLDGRAFALSTLKRLGSLLWAGEPTLRSIRNPRSPNYHNVYTWGSELRRFSRLAQATSESVTTSSDASQIDDSQVRQAMSLGDRGISQQDRLALCGIWRAESHRELGRLLSGTTKQYRRLGFNFGSFGLEDERSYRSPRTLEFRIMEGTVRSDLVAGWVAICSRIAETATMRTDTRFATSLGHLLQRLNKGDDSADTGGDTLGRRRGREFSGLMQDLGVPRAVFAPFEDKVIREHTE